MKKIIITIIAIVILVCIVVGMIFIQKSNNNKSDLKTIQVNEVTRSVFYAPQYVAISKGFFKDHGIKIELTTGQGADAVMTAVLSINVI